MASVFRRTALRALSQTSSARSSSSSLRIVSLSSQALLAQSTRSQRDVCLCASLNVRLFATRGSLQAESSDIEQPISARADAAQPGSASTGGESNTRTLYVGNLYFGTKGEAVKKRGEEFGEVVNVRMMYDERGYSRGYAFMEFATEEQRDAAQQGMASSFIDGRQLIVQPALRLRPAGGPRVQRSPNPPSRTLFIGNIPYDINDTQLNEIFSPLKNATDIRVAMDRNTGQIKGFAHVDFTDVESATEALKYIQENAFQGRQLRVDFSLSKRFQQRPSESQADNVE